MVIEKYYSTCILLRPPLDILIFSHIHPCELDSGDVCSQWTNMSNKL